MRARSIYDKAGNSYRFQREAKRVKEAEDKKASAKIWNKIYARSSPKKPS